MTPKPWAKKISVLTWLILGGYHEILEKMSSRKRKANKGHLYT